MLRQPLKFTLFPYTTLFRSDKIFSILVAVCAKVVRSGIGSSINRVGIVHVSAPVSVVVVAHHHWFRIFYATENGRPVLRFLVDRKSTRLNSSHSQISYAVFC